jgi:hypothetical protein
VLETVEQAADAVDVILMWEARLERLDNQFAAAKRRYDARRARVEQELEEGSRLMLPALEAFYAAHPPAKGKTLHLPTGDLGKRKLPGAGELSIKDRDAVVAWAESTLPEAIVTEVKKNLDVQRVRLRFAETGEVPPGAEVKPEIEKLYISAPRAKKGS